MDGNGEASDWIEIQNLGDAGLDLGGYYLTDDPERLTRWQFPATPLAAGGTLVVFADGSGQADPAGRLHTNFGLDGDGEYVALVAPNGRSIVSQLAFPEQQTDISYGWGQSSTLVPLLPAAAAAKWLVPTAADAMSLGTSWRGGDPTFDDAGWLDAQLGVGFGEGTRDGGNLARGADVTASGPLWTGFVPTRLTDGNRSTISHPAGPVASFEFVIDLGVDAPFDHIDVYNRNDGCCPERLTNYRVTVHADDEGAPGPAVWSAQIRADGTNSGVGGVDVIDAALDPLGNFGGRFITIAKIDDGKQDYWPQIAEVEVYPSQGYGEYFQTNVEASLLNVNASGWLRTKFQVADPKEWTDLELQVQYDDGFIAYLNGVEVARRQAPQGEPSFDAAATSAHVGSAVETILVSPEALRAGENVLAFQTLNAAADDPDFLLAPKLNGRQVETSAVGYLLEPTPGDFNGASVVGFLEGPLVDVPRGFFDAAFDVTLTSSMPGATLIYTTDSSTPSRDHGTQVVPRDASELVSTTLNITTTTTLRVIALKDGYADAPVVTYSYLFLDDVIHQPAGPPGLPTSWAGASADYEMDPAVVDDPAYRQEIIQGLRSIPTLSIVTDNDNLWDDRDGIYINSTQRGETWERPVSLEWLEGDGTAGFQVNAGIRMWGTGWAPHSSSRKHSFQLKFKRQYGPSKLQFPIFPDAPVDEFDDIVLRAQGSRSWYDFRQPDITQSQYIRDAFARDTARDMGKLEGHATFVHLYLNGLYWGLYNPVERTDEAFAETYLGGDAEDYDVINKRSGQATHATSGNMDAWNAMMDIADAGLGSDEAYAAIQQYLDVDDFIDYMLIQQYATNHDGPDQGGNNMRALRRRDDSGRFTFHVWDMEYTMWYEGEHRNIDGDVADSPMRLFNRLRQNDEFRLRFADHVRQHLFNDGALTPERAAARWEARADEIYGAVIGESARWGDGRRRDAYTRDVEWVAERDRLLNEYFPRRTDVLLGQLTDEGLFPRTAAPVLNQQGGVVPKGFRANVTTPTGTVFYTLDGSDPRLPGGAVSPLARNITPYQRLISDQSTALWMVPQDASNDRDWTDPDQIADPQQWTSDVATLGYDISVPTVPVPVVLQNATATFSQLRRPIGNTIDGDFAGRGWGLSQPVDFQGPVIRAPIAVWETATDVGFADGTEVTLTLTHDSLTRGNLGRFRLAVTGDDRSEFADGLEQGGDVTANWETLVPFDMKSAEDASFTVLPDGSIRVDGGANRRDTYTIRAITSLNSITGIRLETIKDSQLPGARGQAGQQTATRCCQRSRCLWHRRRGNMNWCPNRAKNCRRKCRDSRPLCTSVCPSI